MREPLPEVTSYLRLGGREWNWPTALRGWVMSAYVWAVVGMAPAGSLLFGLLAERWGAPAAILSGALVCAVGAGTMLVVFPQVRRME
jgi:MFS family permease